MPLNSNQVTVGETAIALMTFGAGFKNLNGSIQDPIPVIIQNTDSTNTVYIGGPTVTIETGYPLIAGASLPMQLVGNDLPYAIASVSELVVAVLSLRQ